MAIFVRRTSRQARCRLLRRAESFLLGPFRHRIYLSELRCSCTRDARVAPRSGSLLYGVPNSADNAQWSAFWAAKLLRMSRQGVVTFKRPLRYRNQVVNLPTGGQHSFLAAEEKGIDV